MFVRLSIATATLASGLIIGNWYFSFPSHTPSARADAEKLAAFDSSALPDRASFASTAAREPQQPPEPVALVGTESRVWPDATVARVPAAEQPSAGTQWAITRDLQAELVRLGCYGGPTDGRWSPALRYALQDFTARLNATLPIEGPDVALLSLARGQRTAVCGASATVTVSEQTALGGETPTAYTGYVPDGAAASLDGRMSLGATAGSAPKTSFSSRRAKDDKIFTHPLGQF